MAKVYQFKTREQAANSDETEGVKQIRRNMAMWGRRQAKLLKNRDEINESAKCSKFRNPN
jgi:hypothetical protein